GGALFGLPHATALDTWAFEKPLNTCSEPLEIGGRTFLILARAREIDPQLPYEKVEGRVRQAYVQAKQKELSDALVRDLQARYAVRLEGELADEGKATKAAAKASPPAKK